MLSFAYVTENVCEGERNTNLYRDGSFFRMSMLMCCSMRLYSRMGSEVKLML